MLCIEPEELVAYTATICLHESKGVKFVNDEDNSLLVPNQYFTLSCGSQSFTTVVRDQASSSSFDLTYSFKLTSTKTDLYNQVVDVSCYHSYLVSSKIIGRVAISVGSVYDRPSHELPRTWSRLQNDLQPGLDLGSIGFSMHVLGPLDQPPDTSGQTSGSGVEQSMIEFYNLVVSIHRGQDIEGSELLIGSQLLDPVVQVQHGANRMRTLPMKEQRSPEWNTQFVIPTNVPTMDPWVRVSLYNGLELQGYFIQDFLALTKSVETTTRWFNFYKAQTFQAPSISTVGNTIGSLLGPLDNFAGSVFRSSVRTSNTTTSATVGASGQASIVTGWDRTPEFIRAPTIYVGRVLITMLALKTQSVTAATTSPAGLPPNPPSIIAKFQPRLYEVSSLQGNVGPISVELSLGPHSTISQRSDFNDDVYRWQMQEDDEVDPALPEQLKIYIPPLNQVWDVALYIRAITFAGLKLLTQDTTMQRVAVARIPLDRVLESRAKPVWVPMKALDTGIEAFRLLIAILYEDGETETTTQLLAQYESRDFLFRASVYEAINLLCPNQTSTLCFPNPYVRIELGGRTFTTRHVERTCHPAYYQAFESRLSLPKDLSIAPNISIDVYHKAVGLFGSNEIIGRCTFPVSKVPVVWDSYPVWLNLDAPDKKKNLAGGGSILCAFELVPLELEDQYEFFEDIRPTTFPADVELFILGSRLFEYTSCPRIRLSYGRNVEDTAERLWTAYSGNPVEGNERCWDFHQTFRVGLELPKRHIHGAWLEVEVFDANADFTTATPLCQGFIPLTRELPWLSEEERVFGSDFFSQLFVGGSLRSGQDGGEKKSSTASASALKDPEAANAQEVGEFLKLDGNESIVHKRIEPPDRAVGPAADFYFSEAPQLVETGEAKVGSSDELHEFERTTGAAAPVGGPPAGKKRKGQVGVSIFGYDASDLYFQLEAPDEEEGAEDERREVVDGPLEDEFVEEDLPYKVIPLLSATQGCPPYIAGKLKYLVTIAESGEDGETKAYTEYKQKKQLCSTELRVQDLITRVYLLNLRSITSPEYSPSAAIYFQLQTSESTVPLPGGLVQNVIDTARAIQALRFNNSYQLPTDLPRNSVLTISCWQRNALSDILLGTTNIDLEDRWWNASYRNMVTEQIVPIEQRGLFKPGMGTSGGILRLWVDILARADAQNLPISVLSITESEPFQIRVVIWSCRKIQMGDQSSISFLSSAQFRHDDDSLEVQWTDTHYNSTDGSGQFNWRMVFDFVIPSRFQQLRLTLNHHALIGTGELIGENLIDLTSDFIQAKRKCRTQGSYKLSKQWINLCHPSLPTKSRAEVLIESSIVSSKEAATNPVGKGRSEPNRNPHLDEVTTNRTYIDWVSVNTTIKDIGNVISRTTIWGLWIAVGIFVLSSIVFLVFMFKK